MRRVVFVFLIYFTAVIWSNNLPVVENFEFNQRQDGSKIVDIVYDVHDADGDTLTVGILVSDDGGETWEVNCNSLSGDFGDGIISGTDNRIFWDFGAEHPNTFGENYVIRLLVDDHNAEDNFEWCIVEAGTFTSGENDEILSLDYDYEIMKYEVTNAQYVTYLEEAFAAGEIWIEEGDVYGFFGGDEYENAGEHIFYKCGTPSFYNYGQISYNDLSFNINVPDGYDLDEFNDHPVVSVSWYGATAFADHYGLRLPTEQEWEKAARGMTGYDYSWGDSLSSDRANYHLSGDSWEIGTTPVGYYNGENDTTDSQSPYGCYDMNGNADNWTSTRYLNTTFRVARGGSFLYPFGYSTLCSWFSDGGGQTMTNIGDTGFRCARSVN